jgi:hypothetical protein
MGWVARVRFLAVQYFSLPHSIQTSQKVAGSIPDEVNVFYQFTESSGCTKPWSLLSL